MSTWAEQRRADRVAAREQDRLDRAAEADLRRQERADREQAADRRRERRAQRRAARRAWVTGHVVELLIYPLALVSAAMAVPAMAEYGHDVYGNAAGYVLPVLSELGMWAFAASVHVSRHRHPDRPTAMLTAGIAVFATVGAVLNFAHGAEKGIVTGLVMAVVSVAGVVAHQLAVAAPPRSRAERAAARIARLEARRIARARRLAARNAVVELAADGSARLMYAPGVYTPRRGRLEPATVPGLPVDPPVDEWDRALAELVEGAEVEAFEASPDAPVDCSTTEPDLGVCDGESGAESGGVGVLDRSTRPGSTGRSTRPVDPTARRVLTPDEARDAARRIAQRQGRPVTAEQLRRALRISAATARRLRDEVNAEFGGQS